ncbi:hypothetical protein HED63_23850 [Ochrobactrum cytisi]|nr:hypothetical protein [Brucella cytisi]
MSPLLAGIIVLASAGLIGAFSGALSAALSIHPLIVTLGVGTMVQAGVQIWTRGLPTGSAPAFINDFCVTGWQHRAFAIPLADPFTILLTLGTVFLCCAVRFMAASFMRWVQISKPPNWH